MILVTGGAGFIGANFVIDWLAAQAEPVVNLDKLTYAGNRENLAALAHDARHIFVEGDICNRALVDNLLAQHRPRAIVHFAAESHVDRAICGPAGFIRTNIEGTFTLLEAARVYWKGLSGAERDHFRFLHVSTDEVYGSLATHDSPATETTGLRPGNPYSASKAAADHLVAAWQRTYGLPTLITRCSNNYGPFQFPEKLIPLMITAALAGKPLPLYGDGLHVRDWLHVSDHCTALRAVLASGQCGQTWNIGSGHEMQNLALVETICQLLDELQPDSAGSHAQRITFVADRAGHDRRYAMNTEKIRRELGWHPAKTFAIGIRETVRWYLEHRDWVMQAQQRAQHQGRLP